MNTLGENNVNVVHIRQGKDGLSPLQQQQSHPVAILKFQSFKVGETSSSSTGCLTGKLEARMDNLMVKRTCTLKGNRQPRSSSDRQRYAWGVALSGTTGVVLKDLKGHVKKLECEISLDILQRTAILGTASILRRVLQN
ncbi:unnamed protein product [Darwinula stevensoni]|uniref:Uncharacterized protein n=1 Tax=Darwinula stevensoni TaxID=69355 RepID=A0A7R8X5L2_9CRUS|nr:unnamed protein product [Darwinula stevensoni]CAG0886733.1 unnamed protein product [Darwinula stevensoni]